MEIMVHIFSKVGKIALEVNFDGYKVCSIVEIL